MRRCSRGPTAACPSRPPRRSACSASTPARTGTWPRPPRCSAPTPARHAGLLDVLVDRHLLERRDDGRYEFHDLLRAYAATVAEHDDAACGRRPARAVRPLREPGRGRRGPAAPRDPHRRPVLGRALEPRRGGSVGVARHRAADPADDRRAGGQPGRATHARDLSTVLWHGLRVHGHYDAARTLHALALAEARRHDDPAGRSAGAHRPRRHVRPAGRLRRGGPPPAGVPRHRGRAAAGRAGAEHAGHRPRPDRQVRAGCHPPAPGRWRSRGRPATASPRAGHSATSATSTSASAGWPTPGTATSSA